MLYISDSCLEVEPLLSLDKYIKFIAGMRSIGRCWYYPNSEKGPACIITTKKLTNTQVLSVL